MNTVRRALAAALLWAVVNTALPAHPAIAATTTGVLTGYALTTWAESERGPFGAIAAIAQDANGYLWVGTSAGLFRFDGARFTSWDVIGDSRLPAGPVSALLVGRDRSLWVGLANGAGVARIRGRVVELFDARQQGSISALVEAPEGTIWAVADPGLYRLEGRQWTRVPVLNGTANARVVNAGAFKDGRLWAGSTSGLFVQENDRTFHKAATGWAWAATEDTPRSVWVTDVVVGVRQVAEQPHPQAGFEGNGYRVIHDRRGNLWVATIGEGLWRVRPRADGGRVLEKATLQSGLFSDSVQSLLEDSEGNVWVGTTVGLHRLTPQKLTAVTNVGLVTAAEASGADGLWLGTSYGLVGLPRDGWQQTASRATIAGPYIRTVRRDKTGVLWASTYDDVLRVRDGRLQSLTIPAVYGLETVTCMNADTTGGMWLGDGKRIVHWDGRRFSPLELPAAAPSDPVVCLQQDAHNRLWVGYRGAQLGLVDGGTFRLFPPETFGVDAGTINNVVQAASGVWVITNAGLSRFADGRFTTITAANGLPPSRASSVVEDRYGHLWVSLDVGIISIGPEEIDKAAKDPGHRIRYQFYDTSDGLAGAPLLSVRSGLALDGKLWFIRGGALTIADPQGVRDWPRTLPGPVRIERATADDRRLEASPALAVPAGTKRVGIDYTAVALTQPNRVRFRYRLDGFDTEWVQAGTRRSAYYTNLPPREYRFVVEASTEEDGWTGSPASLTFNVRPAFYQTGWFYGLCALVVGAAVAGTWRLRVRLVRREYSAVLAERARLSREIHDTLLQSLVGVALQLDGLSHGVCAASAEARDTLVRTRLRVEAYVREARQSILDLRSPVLDTLTLADALREIGRDVAGDSQLQFSLSVAGKPRRCAARLENELLRIGHEAMVNAARHAQARHIHLDLRFDPDAVVLKVQDDGRGFTPQAVKGQGEAHYGLASMRERAENLGGRFSISPSPSGGTEVEAVVPTQAAA